MERFFQCLTCTDCRSADPNKRPDLPDLPHRSSPPYRGVLRVPAKAWRAEGPSVRVTSERKSRAILARETAPVTGQDGAFTSHAESARLHEAGAGGHCYSWVQEMVKSNEEPGALVCAKTAEILQVA